jgi:2,3-bisphosphoglycerate-dependent phosphoglycerate mutase
MDPDDQTNPAYDKRYDSLKPEEKPLTECLKDTVERFVPYWNQTIAPDVRAGKSIIISAHGNSLRALIKHLDGIPDEEIPGLEIPTGKPIVYELEDETLKPIRHYYVE